MSIRKAPLISGEYYHIYNRGNSKQKIFHDIHDYNHFLSLLFLLNRKENFKIEFLRKSNPYNFLKTSSLVSIGAYCLMPNHFHILLTETEDGSISKFMQKLTTAYSVFYNKKYKRTGALFEGKFKSKHANNDIYLKYLFSYIHLNPIKIISPTWREKGIENSKKVIKFLEGYKYSSYLDYIGKTRPENVILNRSAFPRYFLEKEDMKTEIFTWLSYGSQVLPVRQDL